MESAPLHNARKISASEVHYSQEALYQMLYTLHTHYTYALYIHIMYHCIKQGLLINICGCTLRKIIRLRVTLKGRLLCGFCKECISEMVRHGFEEGLFGS